MKLQWLERLREERPVLGEVCKAFIDQPLHVAMAAVSVFGFAFVLALFRAPLGKLVYFDSYDAGFGAIMTLIWTGLREARQWPPGLWKDGPGRRWWDPPLDVFFIVVGTVLGVMFVL